MPPGREYIPAFTPSEPGTPTPEGCKAELT